jgi:hypothetical protein
MDATANFPNLHLIINDLLGKGPEMTDVINQRCWQAHREVAGFETHGGDNPSDVM